MRAWARRRAPAAAGDRGEQCGQQLAEQRKRLGFTQAGLADIMGVAPGRVSQIEHGEVSAVEAFASYISIRYSRELCDRGLIK